MLRLRRKGMRNLGFLAFQREKNIGNTAIGYLVYQDPAKISGVIMHNTHTHRRRRMTVYIDNRSLIYNFALLVRLRQSTHPIILPCLSISLFSKRHTRQRRM